MKLPVGRKTLERKLERFSSLIGESSPLVTMASHKESKIHGSNDATNRELKLAYTVHAEVNAILNAAKNGATNQWLYALRNLLTMCELCNKRRSSWCKHGRMPVRFDCSRAMERQLPNGTKSYEGSEESRSRPSFLILMSEKKLPISHLSRVECEKCGAVWINGQHYWRTGMVGNEK